MEDEASLTTCLHNVCGLTSQEWSAILNQGHNNYCRLRRINRGSFTEIFLDKLLFLYIKVFSKKNI